MSTERKSESQKEILSGSIISLYDQKAELRNPLHGVATDRVYPDPVAAGDASLYHRSRSDRPLRGTVEGIVGDIEEMREEFAIQKSERLQDKTRIIELESQLAAAQSQALRDQARVTQANLTISKANQRIDLLKRQLKFSMGVVSSLRTELKGKDSADEPDADFSALGLDPRTAFAGLNEDQIKALVSGVQRLRAKIHHPDTVGGDGLRMKQVNAAADSLKSPSTRGNYRR